MLRVDLFAFGGGFASIPIILHEVVEVRHWMDAKTFLDGIALGQVTPGPIVITATFVGFALEGVPGALVATASIFFPSFFLVLFVWPFFQHVDSLHFFRKGISGVLCSFVGLLAARRPQVWPGTGLGPASHRRRSWSLRGSHCG